VQWYWRRLVFGEQPHQVPGGQIGLGPPRRPAPDAGALHRGGGERVEAIHPEPTGYADFAARFEAAKSRGWPMQMRGWQILNEGCSKT
jgi:hypothetical protein